MNFWTIGYILMFLIVFLGLNGITKNMGLELPLHFGPPLIMAVFLGLNYGFIIGTVYYLLDKRFFRNKPLWLVIFLQALISMVVLLTLVFITRTYIFERAVGFFSKTNLFDESLEGWPYLVSLILLYTFMMTLLISFINQMNRKFGPGILIPMLIGRFRNPREEERVFMFLDLNNSTALAEKLGHVQYSSFVRDCFQEINNVVQKFLAEIYQYVGDEIVLTWNTNEAIENSRVLDFYFSCQERFENKKEYFLTKYSEYPEFKAGAHLGVVTVVEVGDIKRDLAYHGDTLNVAARLEKLCKTHNSDLIISNSVLDKIDHNQNYTFLDLGLQNLKGRKSALKAYSVKIKLD
ncbi:MAG: adenylate/guanylate cyclase domain-containing protein [Cytophagales bacterium]